MFPLNATAVLPLIDGFDKRHLLVTQVRPYASNHIAHILVQFSVLLTVLVKAGKESSRHARQAMICSAKSNPAITDLLSYNYAPRLISTYLKVIAESLREI